MRIALTDDAPLEVARCPKCPTQIVEAETERGERIPVDLTRSINGCLVLYSETLLGELVLPPRVRVASPDDRQHLLGNLWMPHVCPMNGGAR